MIGKIKNFFLEVIAQAKKVDWPSRQQTLRYTVLVLGLSITTAIFLGIFDAVFTTPMPDGNYTINKDQDATNVGVIGSINNKIASGFTFTTYNWNGLSTGNVGLSNPDEVYFTIFR